MRIKDFKVEQWMNEWETKCRYNVAETCTYSVTLDQLFDICGGSRDEFMDEFASRRLTYGDIEGNPAFLEGICGLYETVRPEHVITTHGAAGANFLVLSTLVNPGDDVVCVMPTYQQLYSIPEMCGANVHILHLEREDHYHVDPVKLEALCDENTKLITINNPDNPTGALLSREELQVIVDIARKYDAWLMCDEVYRLLVQDDDAFTTSPIDLYDKAVVVSSMSKVWSLAGIRLGWCITKSEELRHDLLSHRDYDLISCGMFDEAVAAYALAHADKILEARGRHDGARLLRLRHRLVRLLRAHDADRRRAGHAWRRLRGAQVHAHRLCVQRQRGRPQGRPGGHQPLPAYVGIARSFREPALTHPWPARPILRE